MASTLCPAENTKLDLGLDSFRYQFHSHLIIVDRCYYYRFSYHSASPPPP